MVKIDYNEDYYAVPNLKIMEYYQKMFKKYKFLFEFIQYEFSKNNLALDAGCGNGSLTYFLLKKKQKVVSVDKYKYPLQIAKENIPVGDFIQMNLSKPFLFEDSSFDLVVLHEVIEHLEKPMKCLQESFRVLKPGGNIIIKTPNAWDIWRILCRIRNTTWYADLDHTHIRYYNQISIRKLLKKAKFRQVKVKCGTKPFHPRYKLLNRHLPIIGNGVVAKGIKMK